LRERLVLPDVLKGVAVLLMIQVHVTELFSTNEVFNGSIGVVSLFLGGPPAAPVFLAVMGYFVAASEKSRTALLLRGTKLFFGGLLLNLGLNAHLLFHIYKNEITLNPFHYIFGIDILLIAGFSIILLALMKQILQRHYLFSFFLAVFIVFLSQIFFNLLESMETFWDYATAFLGGKFSWSYFPLFPWFAYSLVGFGFHSLLTQTSLKEKMSGKNIIIALFLWLLFFVFTISYASEITHRLKLYYHHDIIFFAWTIIFLSGYVLFFYVIAKSFPTSTMISFSKWVGNNVTPFYVFQWLLIGNIATEIYKTENDLHSLLWFISILTVTSLLVLFWNSATGKLIYVKK